tara:strand:+ start:45 stop:719 length:675 start_codon:yes stop_codon:yes gene_type:complete
MKKIILSVLATIALTGAAFAQNYSMGLTATALYYDASGTETTKSSNQKNNKSDSGVAPIPSFFIETSLDTGATVGLDIIPFGAKVADGSMTSDDDAETSGTNSVDVNFKNHVTLYVETPVDTQIDGSYVKFGISTVTIETDESMSTGSTYGDETVQGLTLGFGVKGDMASGAFYKVEGAVSHYQGATFNGSFNGNSAGDSAVRNVITLDDFQTAGLRLSVGKEF